MTTSAVRSNALATRRSPSRHGSKVPKPPPPLQHGDRLTRAEFERRWAAMPDLKRAELIDGMVYLAAEASAGRRIDYSIPPLQNGDKLSRAEFDRRWENMPDLKKAERLNGIVFMPPPVSADGHGIPHSDLIAWLGVYRAATPGVVVADNSTLRLNGDSDPQPDAMVFVLPEHGGNAHFITGGFVAGTPELVAEVAATSINYDLNLKLDTYRRTLVPEYVVWRTYDEVIDWFVLRRGRYVKRKSRAGGVYKSEVFPGLWLDPAALIRGDLAAVLRVLQDGLASKEHAAFVARLARAAARPAKRQGKSPGRQNRKGP